MNESFVLKSVNPTFAAALGASIFAGQMQYPTAREEPYTIAREHGTYSKFSGDASYLDFSFLKSVASVYKVLVERQENLGDDFESAIFSDVESLYEM